MELRGLRAETPEDYHTMQDALYRTLTVLLCALASSLERAGALSRLQAWPSVTISIA